MRKIVPATILTALVAYVCFAFIGMEIDPRQWDEIPRFLFVFIILFAAFWVWGQSDRRRR